jgi:hypothetical protein
MKMSFAYYDDMIDAFLRIEPISLSAGPFCHGERPTLADREKPGADAVHDARDLSVSRAIQLLDLKSITLANAGCERHVGAATRPRLAR